MNAGCYCSQTMRPAPPVLPGPAMFLTCHTTATNLTPTQLLHSYPCPCSSSDIIFDSSLTLYNCQSQTDSCNWPMLTLQPSSSKHCCWTQRPLKHDHIASMYQPLLLHHLPMTCLSGAERRLTRCQSFPSMAHCG